MAGFRRRFVRAKPAKKVPPKKGHASRKVGAKPVLVEVPPAEQMQVASRSVPVALAACPVQAKDPRKATATDTDRQRSQPGGATRACVECSKRPASMRASSRRSCAMAPKCVSKRNVHTVPSRMTSVQVSSVAAAAISTSCTAPEVTANARPSPTTCAMCRRQGCSQASHSGSGLCHTGSATNTENSAAPATRMLAAKWMARTTISASSSASSEVAPCLLPSGYRSGAGYLPTRKLKLKLPCVVCVSTDRTFQVTR